MSIWYPDRLQSQLGASPHTIASYRDAFRLLLVFASERLSRSPSQLCVDDLDTTLIGAFLDHLEHGRANSPKTRNTRLAALRAFFQYLRDVIYRVSTHPMSRIDELTPRRWKELRQQTPNSQAA